MHGTILVTYMQPFNLTKPKASHRPLTFEAHSSSCPVCPNCRNWADIHVDLYIYNWTRVQWHYRSAVQGWWEIGIFPGSHFPGSCAPGSCFPGSHFLGIHFPGICFPGSRFPGSCFSGSCFPGSCFPGSCFPGSWIPGSLQWPQYVCPVLHGTFHKILTPHHLYIAIVAEWAIDQWWRYAHHW